MKTKFFTILVSFLFLSSFSQDINNFTFECNGDVITTDNTFFDMSVEDFNTLLSLDLNEDGELNTDDITFLFSCDGDSLDFDWEYILNQYSVPYSFIEYINAMLASDESFS